MNEKSKKQVSFAVKVIIPLLIVAAVVVIWVIKNNETEKTAVIRQDNEAVEVKEDVSAPTVTYPLALTKTDLEEIKSYGVPTVIDFGSDDCIPCKQMAPVLEKLNTEWQGKAAVRFMDVWKYTDGVQDFPIQLIPTQVFFTAEGKPFVPSDELASKIQFITYTDRDSGEHIFTVHQGGITEEEMRLIFAEMGVES